MKRLAVAACLALACAPAFARDMPGADWIRKADLKKQMESVVGSEAVGREST